MNAKKKTVLFVTRDKKPGMIAVKIAEELWCNGVEITIVAEGLSVAEWKKSGMDDGVIAEGPLKMDEPWGISPSTTLSKVRPDVVVCGLSSPIRAEAWFAAATRSTGTLYAGIPLVFIDDNWGAVHRCQTQADLVLTIDNLGEQLVRQHELYRNHRDNQVVIIGDLSATAATEPIPQSTIDAFNAAKGDAEYVFILASQKWPESDDIVDIGLASCALSLKAGARIVVIPRFHPGAKAEDKERWNQKVVQFGDEFPDAVKILGDQSISTDHLAALADGTFAATGSALRAAAYAGRIPFCVWTPRLAEKLKAESGMEHHPLTYAFQPGYYTHPMGSEDKVVRALGVELRQSVDITRKFSQERAFVNRIQEDPFQPVPFDAVKAANAILALVS